MEEDENEEEAEDDVAEDALAQPGKKGKGAAKAGKKKAAAKGAWVGAVVKTVEGDKFYSKAKVCWYYVLLVLLALPHTAACMGGEPPPPSAARALRTAPHSCSLPPPLPHLTTHPLPPQLGDSEVALGDAVLLAPEEDEETGPLALVQAMWQAADGTPPPRAAGRLRALRRTAQDLTRTCPSHSTPATPARPLPRRLQGGAGAPAGTRRGDGAGRRCIRLGALPHHRAGDAVSPLSGDAGRAVGGWL